MLRWRLLLGTVFGLGLIALAWLDAHAARPGVWLLPLVLLVSGLASAEMLRLARQASIQPSFWPILLGNLLLPAAAWVGRTHGAGLASVAYPLALLALVVVATFVEEMWRYRGPVSSVSPETGQPMVLHGPVLQRIAVSVLSVAYVGLMLALLVDLRMSAGLAAVLSSVAVVKCGDIGAYTVGRLIGRHKMAPRLSPGKTWEGAAGAVLFSVLAAWLVLEKVSPAFAGCAISHGGIVGCVVFGLVIGLAGMLGDLAESLLKRDAGVKDSGPWLPGFGGVLDLVDSILFISPLAWVAWSFGLI